jgi:integrase/recombinase XerC
MKAHVHPSNVATPATLPVVASQDIAYQLLEQLAHQLGVSIVATSAAPASKRDALIVDLVLLWDEERETDKYSAKGRKRYCNHILHDLLTTTLSKTATARDITESVLNAHKRTMHKRGCKGRTIGNFLTAVRCFCEWCVANVYLDADPTLGVEWPKLDDPKVVFLRDADVQELLDALIIPPDMCLTTQQRFCWQRARLAIFLMLYTGARFSEAATAYWEQFDLTGAAKEFRILHGKGGKNRTVPLPAPLLDELLAVPEAERVGPLFYAWTKHDLPVAERTPLGQGLTHTFERWLPRRLQAFGATLDRASPHQLRRVYATALKRRGVDLDTIRRLLGHKSLETTQHYLDGGPDDGDEAVACLPDAHEWIAKNKKPQ